MYLKKINNFFKSLFIIIFLLNPSIVFGKTADEDIKKALDLIYNTKEFESKFLQEENGSISEGHLYIKDGRIKIQYDYPSKIQIILSQKKAMYFNEDLEEVEYFNPKNSTASIFYDIFYNKNFFFDAEIYKEKNYIRIKKEVTIQKNNLEINILFENNPLVIKKISYEGIDSKIEFNILESNFNPSLDKKFFSMVHPLFKK